MSASCLRVRGFSYCLALLVLLCAGCGAEPDLSSPRAFSSSIAGNKGILDNRVIQGVILNDPYFESDGELMPGSTLVVSIAPKFATDPERVEGVVIKDADIHGLTLEDVQMKGALFKDVTFTGCSFLNVKFHGSVFQRVKFIDCRFEGKGSDIVMGYPPDYSRQDKRTILGHVRPEQVLFENCDFGRYVEQEYSLGSVAVRGTSQIIGLPNKTVFFIRGMHLNLLIEDCNFDHRWVAVNVGSDATIYLKNSTVKGIGLSGSETRVTYVENCTLDDVNTGSAESMVIVNSSINAAPPESVPVPSPTPEDLGLTEIWGAPFFNKTD